MQRPIYAVITLSEIFIKSLEWGRKRSTERVGPFSGFTPGRHTAQMQFTVARNAKQTMKYVNGNNGNYKTEPCEIDTVKAYGSLEYFQQKYTHLK